MTNTLTPIKDEFRGDTASLVRNIVALLEMDAKGVLVPHGIGGHARGLLSAAAVRLAEVPQAPAAPAQCAEGWAIDKSTDVDILVYKGCSVIEDEQAHRLLGLLSAAPAAPVGTPFAYAVRWSDQEGEGRPAIFWPDQVPRYRNALLGQTLVPLYEGVVTLPARDHYAALLVQLEREQKQGATVLPAERDDEIRKKAARYDWMRDVVSWDMCHRIWSYRSTAMDQAIDHAIATHTNPEGAHQ